MEENREQDSLKFAYKVVLIVAAISVGVGLFVVTVVILAEKYLK